MIHELIRLESVDLTLNSVNILNNAWLNVRPGEIVGVLGLRYAGKTSLAKILCGRLHADHARIYFNEEPQDGWNECDAIMRGVVNVSDLRHVCQNLSAMENVLLTQHINGNRVFSARKKLRDHCARLFGDLRIDIDPEIPLEGLSFYEQFEVSMAKAVANGAKLVVVDEVISRLNESQLKHFMDTISAVADMGVSVALFDSDFETVIWLAARLFIIRDGYIVGTMEKTRFDIGHIRALMIGNAKQPQHDFRRGVRAKATLKMLTKAGFAGKMLFEIPEGSITGIVVPPDMDIQDLLCALQGKASTRYRAYMNDAQLSTRMAAEMIGIVYDDAPTFDNLPLFDNITLVPYKSNLIMNFFLNRYGAYTNCNTIIKQYFNEEFLHMYRHGVNNLDHFEVKLISIVRILNKHPSLMVYINPEHRLSNIKSGSLLPKIIEVSGFIQASLIISCNIDICKYACDTIYIMESKTSFSKYRTNKGVCSYTTSAK